jgi:UDP-3-O-[3-hydroxymyristoyl] glucosamine N-acyltransferase
MAVPSLAGDPRFFVRSGPFTAARIAAAARGGKPDEGAILTEGGERIFTSLATLALATPDQVSFLDNRRYADDLSATRAGCVMVHPEMLPRVPAGCVPIVMTEPRLGWARVAALFHPLPPLAPGIHPAAVVDPAATVDPSAEIGPFVLVSAGAEIGPRCRIGPGAIIGAGVVLGPDCRVGAGASLSHTLAGARVYVYPGARIGQEGFGFETTPTGFLTVPQLGRVILEDDVEIGANSTIDRGAIGDTVIGAGSRLDNLVQIGHNVRLGRCCVIVAQVGISGSTVLEDFVVLGGQAGITGHLTLGRGARIGAQAGVMSDVPAGAVVGGSPSQPLKEWFRQVAVLKRLAARPGSDRAASRPDTETDRAGGQD